MKKEICVALIILIFTLSFGFSKTSLAASNGWEGRIETTNVAEKGQSSLIQTNGGITLQKNNTLTQDGYTIKLAGEKDANGNNTIDFISEQGKVTNVTFEDSNRKYSWNIFKIRSRLYRRCKLSFILYSFVKFN